MKASLPANISSKIFIWFAIIIDCIFIVKIVDFFYPLGSYLFNFLIDFFGPNSAFLVLDFLGFLSGVSFILNFTILIIFATIFWVFALNSRHYTSNMADLISSLIKIHLVILFFMAMIALSTFISRH